jgi:hypothetical protein
MCQLAPQPDEPYHTTHSIASPEDRIVLSRFSQVKHDPRLITESVALTADPTDDEINANHIKQTRSGASTGRSGCNALNANIQAICRVILQPVISGNQHFAPKKSKSRVYWALRSMGAWEPGSCGSLGSTGSAGNTGRCGILVALGSLGRRRPLRGLILPRPCSRVASVHARRPVQMRIYFFKLVRRQSSDCASYT